MNLYNSFFSAVYSYFAVRRFDVRIGSDVAACVANKLFTKLAVVLRLTNALLKRNCTEWDQAAARAVIKPGSTQGTCGGPSGKVLRVSLVSYHHTNATDSFVQYTGV